MKFQRFLILVFAAALTAGTCAATSVQFTLYLGSGSQTFSLSVDGTLVGTSGGNTAFPAQDYADGWHSLTIDYTDISGSGLLGFQVNGSTVDKSYLASYDSTGGTINGVQGVYHALDPTTKAPTTLLKTDYGEGPVWFTPTTTPWSALSLPSDFEETLTGYVYLGAGTPLLGEVPAGQKTGDPGLGGAAPEPAGWWLVAAAVPLMLISKLRLRRAKARHSHATA